MSYVLWIIFSIFKYPLSLFTSLISGSCLYFSLTLIGGIIGIVLFTQIGSRFEKWLVRRFPKRFKRFSFKNRMLVKLRRNWGVWGIAFLTPMVLGIPVGVGLALALTTSKTKIIKSMIVSIVIWSMLLMVFFLI